MFATSRANVAQARKDRRSGNPADVALWQALRMRPHGHKFRRQHALANRRLDFACLSARVPSSMAMLAKIVAIDMAVIE